MMIVKSALQKIVGLYFVEPSALKFYDAQLILGPPVPIDWFSVNKLSMKYLPIKASERNGLKQTNYGLFLSEVEIKL